jgi:hypothetical protein
LAGTSTDTDTYLALPTLDGTKEASWLVSGEHCVVRARPERKFGARGAPGPTNGCTTKPMVLHELRWMGYYDLLERYIKIRPFQHLFEDDQECDREDDLGDDAPASVAFPIPTAAEHVELKQLMDDMDSIAYATRSLQSPSRAVSEVRDLFDVMIADFPSMVSRLSPTAPIVQSVNFEAALCKIQTRSESTLRPAEASTVKKLPLSTAPTAEPTTSVPVAKGSSGKGKKKRSADDIHELLKSKKQRREEGMSRYVKTEWIPPTSVAVERVFSQVKAATGYLRRSMPTRTLDGLLVLKLNWDLVSLDVVSDAIKSLRDDSDSDDADSPSEMESDSE